MQSGKNMHLIFDFDGTLVDSFECVIELFNQLADDYNFRKIAPQEMDELRHLSSKELIALFHIPFYKMPMVLYNARKSLHDNITLLNPFNDIPQIIDQLFKAGFSLGIVSSNSEENVISWLKYHQLHEYFNFIQAGASYFGKKRALKKTIRLNRINQAFYIGDETRDIDAASYSNIYSMAVTWGFNSEKILSEHQPHYIAHTPKDILTISLQHQQDKG
jgi:phosphoglycolate phosphatase